MLHVPNCRYSKRHLYLDQHQYCQYREARSKEIWNKNVNDDFDENWMNYLVEYQRKSLMSFVVLICSNKPDTVKELLPQMPTSSLYQLHPVCSNDISLTVLEWESVRSSRFLCETTFKTNNDSILEKKHVPKRSQN